MYSDPGGRLGPYLDAGAPDVRNLRVFFELCREGDTVLLMTDGIHDNLDPKSLGYACLISNTNHYYFTHNIRTVHTHLLRYAHIHAPGRFLPAHD